MFKKGKPIDEKVGAELEKQIVEAFTLLWPNIKGFLECNTPTDLFDEASDRTRSHLVKQLLKKPWLCKAKNEVRLRRWAFRVARNTRNQLFRERHRRPMSFLDPEALEAAVNAGIDPAAKSSVDRLEVLIKTLEMLPAKDRDLLVQHYLEDRSLTEIASTKQKNYWTVAKAKLRSLKAAQKIARKLDS